MKIEKRLEELGITLPPLRAPMANYVPARRAGNLLFLSGQGPAGSAAGKVGDTISVEEAYQHARSVGLGLIAAMKHELGDLDHVKGIIKVLGMVNAVPSFRDQPKVINGCSDLLVEVFGEAGRHARSAVGMGSLPNQIPVEIELIALVE
ncbi:MAG TPA: RidA family protein [Stellaceae bacterium]|nr:RidA family protein [Stellaceae bacterium]